MNKYVTTLCLLKKDDKYLLAKKRRGFGEGKYNGIGGKVEKGESIEQAMIRETQEEISVTPLEYEKVGVLDFDEYYKNEQEHVTFHLYICHKWDGIPKESEEMAELTWFSKDEMPYDNMFPDDRYWLPLILEDKKIKAYFKFDENWRIIEKKIEIL